MGGVILVFCLLRPALSQCTNCQCNKGRNKRSVMHEDGDYNDDSCKCKSQYGENKGYDTGRSHAYQSEPIYGDNYDQQNYAKPMHEYRDYDENTYNSKSQYGENKGYDTVRRHSYPSEPIYGRTDSMHGVIEMVPEVSSDDGYGY